MQKHLMSSEVGKTLASIPDKRYFTLGEVSSLCGVMPHTLREWDALFFDVLHIKQRGKRRYYQRQSLFIIRQIKTLLEQQLTVEQAKHCLLTGSLPNPSLVAATKTAQLSANSELIHELKQDLQSLLELLDNSAPSTAAGSIKK